MTMPTVPFGRTDMQITRVGFGAWAIGGGGWAGGWGAQDDVDSVEAISHAVESGVNWIDTAAAYGQGHSEEVVGQALKRFVGDDRPYVFTKCGLIFEGGSGTPSNVLAPASIRRELDASLSRLGIEQIDLYQVHWPPQDGTSLEEYWSTMCDLRQEGKVRAIGMSNHDAPALTAAEAVGHVDSLQPPLSLIHREAAAELLPWCAEHGTAVIVYSPMQSGLLSGRMTAERVAQLPDDDWRGKNEDFTGDKLTANLAVADALRPIAQQHGVEVPAVAVAWTLAWPAVTAAIVGARKPDQVDGWLPAGSVELTDDELDTIAEVVRSTGAGAGPERPSR